MRATATYAHVTARTLGPKTIDWIAELVEEFGDDQVSVVMSDVAAGGCPPDKLLGRVRDVLAKDRAMRSAPPKAHYSGRTILGIARGEYGLPQPPYTFDAQGLTDVEYSEVLAWRMRQAGYPQAMKTPAEAGADGGAA